MLLAIVPLLGFGLISLLITSRIIYSSLEEEVEDSLNALLRTAYQAYELEYPGDFAVQDGILMKGAAPVRSQADVVNGIKERTGVDATLFYGSERVLTTLKNQDGDSAIRTLAAQKVIQTVLLDGQEYFSDTVLVNGVKYFGYYIPVSNSDGSIIGMMFVGRPRTEVMKKIGSNIFLVCAIAIGTMAIVIAVICHFSRKLIYSLNCTENFLSEISRGNLKAQLDPYVLNRQDEIGEMGRFAVLLQKSIEDLVGKDTLTGLYNRRSCDIILKSLTEKEKRQEQNFTVVMADIDFFKKVNDEYGHQAGDEVLKHIARLMEEHMEHLGFVFRWGGEEFLLIYEDMGEEEAVCHLKELQEKIDESLIRWNEEEIRITMTYGLSDYRQEEKPDKLVCMADENLYIGKKNGRDQIVGSRIRAAGRTEKKEAGACRG